VFTPAAGFTVLAAVLAAATPAAGGVIDAKDRSTRFRERESQLKRFYRWTRDLHLYFGLFISPFVLLFAVSVLFLNHGKVAVGVPDNPDVIRGVRIPPGLERTQGPEAVDGARDILSQVGLTGEVGFTRYVARERRFSFPVSKPGIQATVDVDLVAGTAVITRRKAGFWETLAYLHKSPGPHNAAIRGNWMWTRVWRWLADATIYLTMFISVSGIYLWYALKAERRVGVALLTTGAVSLCGLIYAVIR
jgi:hypothetical protein